MTIALLSAASSIHTIRWANAFAERGHQMHLITQHAPAPGLDVRVMLHQLPHLKGLGYLLNGWRVSRLLARIRPDVVNAHYATGYGTLARWSAGFPLVLNVWGSDVFAFPEKSALHRWWVQRNLAHADRIVSTSEVMATRTRSLVGKVVPVAVVPFGVDMDRFTPADKAPGGPVVVGTVKTLEPVYGVDRLVEAFIALCRMGGSPALDLRIVGAGSQRAVLEQRIREVGLAERVVFTGAVAHEQVPDELRKLDIYVALSRSESFGVAVIEASACGLPVVVSDVGGLPEVVQHGVTGMVVEQTDPTQASEAIAALVRDPDLRQRMGQAGRTFVLGHYAWKPCVDRMLAVLMQVQRRVERA